MPFAVNVQREVRVEHIPSNEDMIAWAQATHQDPIVSIDLNIRIVGSEEIQALNKLYRGRDKVTNVLSFTSTLPPGMPETHVLADVVICAELVEQEAAKFEKPLKDRWAHMIVHGCLHVQGFDHEEEDEREFMEAEERKILKKFHISDPYAV